MRSRDDAKEQDSNDAGEGDGARSGSALPGVADRLLQHKFLTSSDVELVPRVQADADCPRDSKLLQTEGCEQTSIVIWEHNLLQQALPG